MEEKKIAVMVDSEIAEKAKEYFESVGKRLPEATEEFYLQVMKEAAEQKRQKKRVRICFRERTLMRI